ncbi:glycoside hydrolase family 3 C-terminal domain-containing protein [Actinomadura sp. NTSP31]|uniref:glycoside hydrolase family 3 C-terminal domain-containing protein n=1 Tax=Actinomadura sp. NTSP31 TaxID=1735447 RepID=UPI0035C17AC6
MDIDQLTLEEKASLLSGRDFAHTERIEHAGLASIALSDGPHGVRWQGQSGDHLGIGDSVPATCFPPAVAVGSSWDPEVAARLGAALGREARALGISVSLGPGLNIKRSPLCGRNFEYYSEDPLLTGVLAAAHVCALQGEGVGASIKHFAANNQETDRMRVSAEVDERTLREIYLPAFEHVVKNAQPATVMAAYNRLNGVHATESSWLLGDVLRTEWGFDGLVVSDWGAVGDRVAALKAGTDLQMPGTGGIDDAKVVQAVRNGELDEAIVDDSVRRIVALTRQYRPEPAVHDAEAHHRLARELAGECAVLLKNDADVLPIASRIRRIAVIGEQATNPRFQGAGSSHITPTHIDTPLEAIQAFADSGDQTVTYAPQLDVQAAEAVREADIAIVFAGLSADDESEGFDREHIHLPTAQVETIRATAAVAARTVVVLSNGGVVSLEDWHTEVDAILEGWLLGQAGGSAIADLLFGAVNPSGRLAETIPLRLQDNPVHLNFPGEAGKVLYGERVMVGYRYYGYAQTPVRYPFGHGLSYTTFETTDLAVTVTGDDCATAALTVTNTGSRPGKHVVQLYIAPGRAPVQRPVRELRAFTKVALAPGESTRVEMPLSRRAFAYYDVEASRWTVAPGEYTVQIGESAARIVAQQTITLTGQSLAKPLSLESPLKDWFDHPVAGPRLLDALSENLTAEQKEQAESQSHLLRMIDSMPIRQFIDFTGLTVSTETLERLAEESRAASAAGR